MHKLLKIFGASVSSLGAIAIMTAANAADPARGGTATGRAGALGANAGRWSSQKTIGISAIGNMTTNNPQLGSGATNKPNTPNAPVDSEYSVEDCMNDILACVNGGALPNGLNDLFNADLRNSIMNGMGLCSVQVERCIADVSKGNTKPYAKAADVWADFNSRRVQPEYYNFVLRKTGLTPNQAENTCLLLDRNTYGSSFAAVSADGTVTTEYNKNVNPYNGTGGTTKANPLGVDVNRNGDVDAGRGYYARWDATTATCLVRVAAYNKDKLITNTWLFGAAGNDEPAEVWKATGETFTCNKDLFGMSLMNKTRSAAVVGMAGGAVVGAGVGLMVGHGAREFDCSGSVKNGEKSEKAAGLAELDEQIKKSGVATTLRKYIKDFPTNGASINQKQCEEVVKLSKTLDTYESVVTTCKAGGVTIDSDSQQRVVSSEGQELNRTEESSTTVTGAFGSTDPCTFHSLDLNVVNAKDILCSGGSDGNQPKDCISLAAAKGQVAELKDVFSKLDVLNGQDSTLLESAGIGAGIGAGAGGLATAITAFVERNNVTCNVGDGLNQVSMGKSHKIDSLKDFYVKWNLNLPDAVAAMSVSDCASWQTACSKITDLNQCVAARVSYRPASGGVTSVIESACQISGTKCVYNQVVAISQGVCQ